MMVEQHDCNRKLTPLRRPSSCSCGFKRKAAEEALINGPVLYFGSLARNLSKVRQMAWHRVAVAARQQVSETTIHSATASPSPTQALAHAQALRRRLEGKREADGRHGRTVVATWQGRSRGRARCGPPKRADRVGEPAPARLRYSTCKRAAARSKRAECASGPPAPAPLLCSLPACAMRRLRRRLEGASEKAEGTCS